MSIIDLFWRRKKDTADVVGLDFAGLTVQTSTTLIINHVIFLIISIITARILGPAGKGILTVIILYPTLLFTFGHLSIYRALTVHITEKKYPFSDFPGSVVVFAVAASLLLIVGFIIAFFNFNRYFIQNINFFIILFALGIIPCSMLIQTFSSILQAKGRMGEFNLRTIAHTGLILLFMIVMLIIFKTGVNGAVFSYFIANFLTMFLVIYFVKRISKEKWRFNPSLLKGLIGDGAKLHIGIIASFIFLRIDMLMLGYYRQASSVGYYSIAVSMADLLILIPVAIQHVFYSKIPDMISDKPDMARKTVLVYKHALLLSVVFALFLAAIARPAIQIFYGEKFLPSFIPFLILLPGVWYLWQNNILAYYFIGTKRFLLISLVAAFSAFINVVFNLIFIPKFDAVGAALASLITYFIVGSAYLFFFFYIAKFKFKEFVKELAICREDIMLYKTFFKKFLKKK